MQQTTKPKGLAKIWREIKRPFKKCMNRLLLDDESRRKMDEFRGFAKTKHVFVRSADPFHRRYIDYFHRRKGEISELIEKLIVGMDELSCDVVHRICSPYRFIAENDANCFLGDESHCLAIPLSVMISDREKEAERSEEVYKNKKVPYAGLYQEAHCLSDKEKVNLAYHSAYNLRCFSYDSVLSGLKGKDIIDGGAYFGDTSLAFAVFSPRSVHAFEPNDQTCAKMISLFSESGHNELMKVIPKAISRHTGTISFFGAGKVGDTTLPDVIQCDKIEVPCISLDDYCETENPDVGLIKLNIEGAEYDAIQGAVKTIRKFRPILAVDLYHTPKDFFEIKPFLESLDLKYRFFIRQRRYIYCSAHTSYCLYAWPE